MLAVPMRFFSCSSSTLCSFCFRENKILGGPISVHLVGCVPLMWISLYLYHSQAFVAL